MGYSIGRRFDSTLAYEIGNTIASATSCNPDSDDRSRDRPPSVGEARKAPPLLRRGRSSAEKIIPGVTTRLVYSRNEERRIHMAAITRIEANVRTGNRAGAGTDGNIFLGIAGREFVLDST